MNPYLTAIDGMKHAIEVDEKLLKSFTRREYPVTFEKVYQKLLPTMEAVEGLYNTVDDNETMLGNMADALVEQALAYYNSTDKKNKKQIYMMNLNLTLVVYVFPILLHYEGNSSRPLCEQIQKKWKEAFPKSEIQIADKKLIDAGFHRKFCYITTAVCRATGKADDCYELTLLRNYRDEYLGSSPDGEALIDLYYDIAPTIVKHIDAQNDSRRIYDDIWSDYISPCIRMIEQDEKASCKQLYEQMVLDLKERYFMS